MNKGIFITFEGGEGSGKTTVIKMLEERLNADNINFIVTREPGGTKIAEQIREIILCNNNTEMNAKTEALLYAASRSQHVSEIIMPALLEGKLVICDRYVDSSVVYQGAARGNSIEDIISINNFAMDSLYPDLTFFLNINPENAFKRLHSREMNRLDLESMDFHYKVYDAYLELAKQDRYISIDANKTVEEIVSEVLAIIKRRVSE